MCCPEPINPVNFSLLEVQETSPPKEGEKVIYHVKGMINPTSTLSIGVLEKLAELCDEIYHLFASWVIPYSNAPIKKMLFEIHHGLHHIEHVLHAVCFIEDIRRVVYCIKNADFVEYVDDKRTQINYLRLAARICHGTAHFFGTLNFLSELNIVYVGEFQRVFKCASLIAALAHALLATSVLCYHKKWSIKHRDQSIHQHPSLSQMGIHVSGFFFEVLPWVETLEIFVPYAGVIKKITALAGIIHAWFIINQGQIIEAKGSVSHHHHCHSHKDHKQ